MAFAPLLAQAAETETLSGFEAIQQANGFGIAITGMAIVFAALVAISLFIGVLPRVLAALGPWLPEIHSHHDQMPASGPPTSSGTDPRMVAAIAWAVKQPSK